MNFFILFRIQRLYKLVTNIIFFVENNLFLQICLSRVNY